MRPFDYTSDQKMHSGQMVVVPFGKTQAIGIVLQEKTSADIKISKLKAIIRPLELPALPAHYLTFAQWLSQYYAAHTRAVWQTLLPAGLKAKPRASKEAHEEAREPVKLPPLSAEQQKTYRAIIRSKNNAILLQGITGSGKTRIYEQLVQDCLQRGRSALILAPEIVLSTHLQQRLATTLGTSLHVTHSGLTASQRRAVWLHSLKSNKPQVYLGARSALFLPIQNLGLIIIDEEHDSSYKQDQAPRYHAVQAAGRLAQITQARLVLGSATPSLNTMHLVHNNRIGHVTLRERHGSAGLPTIDLIEHRTKNGVLSLTLREAIGTHVARGEQVLLLHNMRGTARRLSCDSCGMAVHCSFCDTPMVFHADHGRLICHVCNRNLWPPSRCPHCQHDSMRYLGIGTKQLVQEVQSLFPTARIERLDRDSIDRATLPALLDRMQHKHIDILIGTQMIAKGLDFPHVTLVAIVDTDSLLQGNDYSASERAASLIIQVAGRAGRGKTAGRVILQTHNPSQPILQLIQAHDWDGIVEQELMGRDRFHYPPYRWLARLWLRRSQVTTAERVASEYAQVLQEKYPHIEVLGPSTPLRHKEGTVHTRQLVLRSTNRALLLSIAAELPSDWHIDLDPIMII